MIDVWVIENDLFAVLSRRRHLRERERAQPAGC